MRTILIVDDSASVRQQVGLALKQSGYSVVEAEAEAEDGRAAMIVLARPGISLVIGDVNMPRMNGLELLESLKRSQRCLTIPILMLSSESHPDLVERAKKAGAAGWIVKPIDATALLAAVAKLLGRKLQTAKRAAGGARDRDRILSTCMISLDPQGLAQHGIVKVAGAITGRPLAAAREALMQRLCATGTWPRRRAAGRGATTAFQQIVALSGLLRDTGDLHGLLSPALSTPVAALLGRPIAATHAQWLVSLPMSEPWRLHALSWHRDASAPARDRLPGLQVFVLLDELLPRGGATLALAGSHRIDSLPGAARDRLHDELRAGPPASLLKAPGQMQSLPVALMEMTGRAGDAYVMDMRVLHTPTVNASKGVRLMATARFLCE